MGTKLHIMGACGTFMGGIAALAKQMGFPIEGSDQHVYPPMSTQLENLGISLHRGYDRAALEGFDGEVIVGNALSRGTPAIEYMLNQGLTYTSGPAWLGRSLLARRPVLAVAGTHGKTTTTSLVAHLLEEAGCHPGFLIGGVPGNFAISARLGGAQEAAADSPFVIEADEYDTAFFDKRSKFVHYHANIAVLNNLEYDHADIFPDLAAIQRQFHHFVRTIPGNGRLIVNAADKNLAEVLAMGCWTEVETFGIGKGDWQAHLLAADGSHFEVRYQGKLLGEVSWSLLGEHNVLNALAALAATHAYVGHADDLLPFLARFLNVKRRMQKLADIRNIHVYDDFAHHPTAIQTTLEGLRKHVGKQRIVVAMEPRSNTMQQGVHAKTLAPSLALADEVFFYTGSELAWDTRFLRQGLAAKGHFVDSIDGLLKGLEARVKPGDHVVFMSNGGFAGAPQRFVDWLET